MYRESRKGGFVVYDVFSQLAGLMTERNAKAIARIMVKLAEELKPPDVELDNVQLHDLRMAFLKLPYENMAQRKRFKKMLNELEVILYGGAQETDRSK